MARIGVVIIQLTSSTSMMSAIGVQLISDWSFSMDARLSAG